MAPYEASVDRVMLGLGGLGHVAVDPDGITISGPDEAARAALWDRLGDWARGEWFAAQGYIVLRGAAVARDGHGVVLTGGSRCGASITGLVMCLRGWSLLGDGIVVIDDEGVVESTRPEVVADADAVAPLPDTLPRRALSTGRPRVAVAVPGASSSPMTHLVRLQPLSAASTVRLHAIPPDGSLCDAVASGIIRPALASMAPSLDDLPRPHAWRLLRPTGATEEIGRAGHPLKVAKAIAHAVEDSA